MPTITLKNVPEDLHSELKERAKRNRRSLNQEALVCLDRALGRGVRDPQAFLEEIRAIRARFPMEDVSLEWIDKAKRAGRP